MAQRRMFNKSVTNSSLFLKMPISSRLLYYDLGMNADDDGFVEHFMVLRMTGATQQDLGVLQANGLVKIFDDNVLWIKDWKENNYIRNDRYTPSKYLAIYNVETLGIPMVDTGKVSIGKYSIDNNKKENTKEKNFIKPTIEEIQDYCSERNNGINANAFYDFYESKNWYIGKNKMKDWKACIRTWEQKQNKNDTKKEIVPEWLHKEYKTEKLTEKELKEMEELMKGIK